MPAREHFALHMRRDGTLEGIFNENYTPSATFCQGFNCKELFLLLF
jgi:hypothetical protein